MYRSQYDQDVVTWSPQGRLHQIEYAMEAVKQGGCSVGLRGARHVVLATLKRSQNELSSFQRKVFKIDDHVGVAAAGLIGDGRLLCRFMRNECINHRYTFEGALPVGRLVREVADRSQVATARSWKRPYGVGLLVAGHDETGPHLFQTCPSGNFYECVAMAIGGRSQASKTYLEKHFDEFESASLEELIKHALQALQDSIEKKQPGLSEKNCSVAVVGDGVSFVIHEDGALTDYLALIQQDTAAEGENMSVDVPDEPGVGAVEEPPQDEGMAEEAS